MKAGLIMLVALGAVAIAAIFPGPGTTTVVDCGTRRATVDRLSMNKVAVKCSGPTAAPTPTATAIPPTSIPSTPTYTPVPSTTVTPGCGQALFTTPADFASVPPPTNGTLTFNNTETLAGPQVHSEYTYDAGDGAVAVKLRADGTYNGTGGWGYQTGTFTVPNGNYLESVGWTWDAPQGGILIPQAAFSYDGITWTTTRAYYGGSGQIVLWPAEHFHHVRFTFFLAAVNDDGETYILEGAEYTPYLRDFNYRWCSH